MSWHGRRLLIVAGAHKCGTTSLWHWLREHPQIVAGRHKEPAYWGGLGGRGRHWYCALFDRDGWWLDASTAYLDHPPAAADLADAAAAGAEVHVVVLLRDPFARAVSHWRQSRRDGWETAGWHQALWSEPRRLGDPPTPLRIGAWGYRYRSDYSARLTPWKAFADRLHLVASERLWADPAGVTAGLLNCIGLPPHGFTTRAHNVGSERVPPPQDAQPDTGFEELRRRAATLLSDTKPPSGEAATP